MTDAFLAAAGALASTEVEPRYLSGSRYGAGQAPAVLRPTTPDDVATLLRLSSTQGVALLVQGAHTGLVQAATPQGQVVLSTERLRGVFELDALDRTLRVSSGFRLSDVNQRLAAHGLQVPIDLGADPCIGGMLAHNTGGTRMQRYGDVRANTLGLEVVLPSGECLRLGRGLLKDNSALAWQHLFIGSSGCLGVITEATLRLHPLPAQSASALLAPANLEAVWPLYQRLMGAFGGLVSAFEGLSANALAAAVAVRGGAAPLARVPPYALLLELSTELAPDRLDLRALLHAELEAAFDTGQLLDAALDKDEALWSLRHAVSEGLREQGAVLGFDISLPRRTLWAFRAEASAWLAQAYPLARVCDFGHLGDGGQHFNLVWPKGAPALSNQALQDLRDGVYERVLAHGGSFSAEHGLGPLVQAVYHRHAPAGVQNLSAWLQDALCPGKNLGCFRLGPPGQTE